MSKSNFAVERSMKIFQLDPEIEKNEFRRDDAELEKWYDKLSGYFQKVI